MAKHLDEQVAAFRNRPLDAGPYAFVWVDALTQKVREEGRIINVHALVAVSVNADGHREILGLGVATAEDGAGWLAFLRSLTARGLGSVQLVVSDAHTGLVNAIGAVLPGTSWQRCRTHWSRKDSTWRYRCLQVVFVLRDGAEEVGGGGVASLETCCGVSVLVQQGRTHRTALPMVRWLTWNRSATTSRLHTLRRQRMVARTRSASVIFSEKIPPRAPNCRSAPRCRCLRRSASAACRKDSRRISFARSRQLIRECLINGGSVDHGDAK